MVKRFTNRTSATGGGVGVGGGSIHMNAVGGIVAGSTPGSQRGSYNNNNANIQSNNQNNNNNITTCGKCCYYFRQVITFLFSHIGLCTLLCCYALIGAFTFQALESVHEKEQRIKMRKLRDVLIRNLSILTNDSTVLRHEIWTRKARKDLIEFEKEFLHAVKYKGYDGYEELSETNSQWSFSGALLYSIIVITTIGYGNVAPRTEWGKVVTILYAIIGIPLMLFCLSNIGHTMARSFKFIYWKCCCYLCVQPKKKRRKRQQKRRQRQRRKRRRHRHAAIQATLMAMNPLLLSHAPKSQLLPSRPRISRSHSSQRCEEPNVRTIKQSSSSNTLQIPQRMLSRSLSARYHNELKASRLRAARLAQTNQIISNKMMPARKTTVNMPPVICNQYASCSDERLDRAISAVHRPHVFPRRSSSIANQNTRSDHRQRPTSLQSPQSYPIKQQPSSNAPHQTVTSQRSGTQSSILHQSRNTQPSLSEIEMTTFYNAPNTLNIHNIDDYRLHIESDLDSYFDNDDDDDDDEDDSEEIQEKNIPITVCLALVISYICGGAWFFSTSEEWSFLDASYFCFITLSTIGFGDLVPGRTVLSTHEDGQMTLAICALYLLFGMALLAMSLNLVKEKVLETVRIVGERIGILVIDEDTDDDSDDDDDDDDVVVDDGDHDGNDNNIDENDNNNDFDSGLNICIHGD